MDPLASSIAILGAVIAICKAVQQVGSNIKNAPKEILDLTKECNELQAVLTDITAANDLRPTQNGAEDPAASSFSYALTDHIKKAEHILKALNEVKAALCQMPSSNAVEMKVKRVGWLKYKKKVRLLRKDMTELKLSFGALLTSRTLFHVSTLDAALNRFESSSNHGQQDAMILLQRILDGRTYTTSILEALPSPPTHEPRCLVEELPEIPAHEPGASLSETPQAVPVSGFGESASPSSTAQQLTSSPDGTIPGGTVIELAVEGTSSTVPLGSLANDIRSNTSEAIDLRHRIRSALLSTSYCRCQCHNLRVSATPCIFTKTLGRLVIGISGQITSDPICNLATCDDKSRYTLTLTYYFPSWWMARAIILRCVQKPNGSPQFSLQTRELLPEHSPMINAITDGKIQNLRTIFSERVCSPNAMEPMGWTGLTWAIHRNEVEVCKFLLTAGADPTLQEGFGNSAIDYAWLAVFKQHVAPITIEYLKDNFLLGQQEEVEKYELTEIHKIVLGLLENDLDQTLSQAAYAMINKPDAFGKTALLWASRRGDLPTVATLLKHGADPNIADQMKRSPLHMAARSRSRPIIDALIKYGGNAKADNFLNEPPAHYTCYESNDISLMEPFVDAGTDVNKPSKYGRTLLDIAVQWDFPDTVNYLISKGAQLEGVESADYTMRPLGRAIFYNSHRALKVLLKAGADTTFMDDKGNTVLHLIARHGSEDTIKIFEAAEGVEYLGDYPNEDDLTAMDYAQKRENEEFQSAFSNFLSKVIGTASTQGQSVEEREN